MKIVFMGTPEFAVPTLNALIDSEHDVVAVYTQPPRPANRGHKLKKSPVHEIAGNIEVRTPKTLRNKAVQEAYTALNADIAVVVAYGLILPKEILEAFPHGCINVHPSLVPRWRGAAPIQRTIMAGDTETCVAILQMDKNLDTGDILMMKKVKISPEDNAVTLHDTLSKIGAELVIKTILDYEKLSPEPQKSEGITYADKIKKEECQINWNLEAEQINNLIRGVYPNAYFVYNGERIKIITAEYTNDKINIPAGTVLDNNLTIACKKGVLRPVTVQKQGKKIMNTEDMLRGFFIEKGAVVV